MVIDSSNSAEDLAAGDIDQDGLMDLVVATTTDILVLFGNGDGTFQAPQTVGSPSPRAVVVADFDGLNGPDIATANSLTGELVVFTNQGGGSFGAGTTLQASADIKSLDTGDVSGDGDVEIVAASAPDSTVQLFGNQGAGSFVASEVDGSLPSAMIASFADINADGNIDLVAYADKSSSGDPSLVWYPGNGDGTFGARQTIASDRRTLFGLHTLDANGDGVTDIAAVGGRGSTELFLNDGTGSFSSGSLDGFRTGFGGDAIEQGDATVTDFDGDGTMDLVGVSVRPDAVGLRLGSGSGAFANETLVPRPDVQVQSQGERTLAAGDVDGNGAADVVLGTDFVPGELVWYENDGSGAFSGKQIVDQRFVEELKVMDFDGDDTDEIIAGDLNDGLEMYEHNQGGGFSDTTLVSGEVSAFEIADVNGDGLQDVVGGFGNGLSVAINSEDGSFSTSTVTTAVDFLGDVAVADLTGNGHPDAIYADNNNKRIVYHPGNGDGTFGSERVVWTGDFGRQLATGDINGDSYVDVAAKVVNNEIGVFFNDGTGSLTLDSTYSANVSSITGSLSPIRLTDVTGEGRPDLIQGTEWREASTSGVFGSRQEYAPGVFGVVALADGSIDPNYAPDLLTASTGDDAIAWYDNTLDTSPNARISAPAEGLRDTVDLGQSSVRSFDLENAAFRDAVQSLAFSVSSANESLFLSVDPSEGTLSSGNTQTIEATLSAVSAPGTTYRDTLRISTTDPDREQIGVPVSLTVDSPSFALNGPESLPSPGDVSSVRLTTPAGFAPTEGTLFYRPTGTVEYRTRSLDLSGLDSGSEQTVPLEVPGEVVTERGVQYFMRVRGPLPDGSDTVQFTVPTTAPDSPSYFPVRIERLTARGSFQPKTYRMLTVPATTGDRSVFAVLEDQYGAYDPSSWRLARWSAQDSTYRFGSQVDSLRPGHAAWLTTSQGDTLSVSEAQSPDASRPQSIRVHPGWNQIGSPFPFPVSWAAVDRPHRSAPRRRTMPRAPGATAIASGRPSCRRGQARSCTVRRIVR